MNVLIRIIFIFTSKEIQDSMCTTFCVLSGFGPEVHVRYTFPIHWYDKIVGTNTQIFIMLTINYCYYYNYNYTKRTGYK